MKKLLIAAILFLQTANLFAQSGSGIEMADSLRSSGKIYVVVATIAITFVGLAIYLFSIDRKLKRLEKDHH
ncbi:CcmD family protein [Mucilaginibacter sp. HC2]|uniref:CcmD family protein n=1 Tax=Mucilaginibacter inviolabilis TaxID=2714892 RepID=UPI00140BFE44|nr:CcmD family protein [Mucilaginibacter inviolabilis]NHA03448.1 CcmD family protein [Mucilaginibacter inviolabilis]